MDPRPPPFGKFPPKRGKIQEKVSRKSENIAWGDERSNSSPNRRNFESGGAAVISTLRSVKRRLCPYFEVTRWQKKVLIKREISPYSPIHTRNTIKKGQKIEENIKDQEDQKNER